TGPQSIHILRSVRQQQDEQGRFSICSRQAAVVHVKILISSDQRSMPVELSIVLLVSYVALH
ncbi:hypothetical protein, partial [Shigella boydii]|uniref:hypothetical protein n=1 Tax=Shigella boydii TaxID=621 RepID=UPI000A9FFDA4